MTQLEAAKMGEITEGMKFIAEREGINPEKLRRSVAKGHTVIFRKIINDMLAKDG